MAGTRLRTALCAGALLCLVLSLMLAGRQPRGQGALPPQDRIVVLISIDGLPAQALADPRISAPTLRRLAREGALAEAMTTSDPSVTWPSHTSMVTGVRPARHGVLFNGMLLRQGPGEPPRIEPWRNKDEMVRAPTVYDLAKQAGLTTAQVDWVAIFNASTIDWEFAERPRPEGTVEQEMIASGLIAREDIEEFAQANITWRDEIWTRAGAHIIEKHRPNLLLFHLLNLDSTHHRYGFGNVASYSAIALADTRVRELLDSIEKAELGERATILIVSDHGFKTATRSIRPNALLRQAGLVRLEDGKVNCDAWIVSLGGTAMVYLIQSAERARLLPRLKHILGSLEGVDRIVEPNEFAHLGLPDPATDNQMGDLLLTAKEGYSFSSAAAGDPVVPVPAGAGSHGYLASDPDMDAVFIAWGYGIRPGVRLERVSNLDIAPTIAVLLGLRLASVEGRVLSEILQ